MIMINAAQGLSCSIYPFDTCSLVSLESLLSAVFITSAPSLQDQPRWSALAATTNPLVAHNRDPISGVDDCRLHYPNFLDSSQMLFRYRLVVSVGYGCTSIPYSLLLSVEVNAAYLNVIP